MRKERFNHLRSNPGAGAGRPCHAFTLLELMLALIIVAALVPILYNSLRVAFREKAAAEAAVEPARTAEVAFDWLRQDLGSAVPPSASTSTQVVSLEGPFEGTEGTDDRGREGDDLQFYSFADSPLHDTNNSEIKSVELCVMTAPNGDHVLARKVIRDLLSDQAPNPDVEVLCRGIGGFSLSYFDGTNWTSTWDSTEEDNTLPAAVQVTLTLDRPNGPTHDPDGSRSFRFSRVFQLPCSTAAFDSTVNSGGVQ
jgi:type II secretion system protein J